MRLYAESVTRKSVALFVQSRADEAKRPVSFNAKGKSIA